jgi:DNA-3-methyladenine glycosylase II
MLDMSKASPRSLALKHFKKMDPYFFNATQAHHASLPSSFVKKQTRAKLFNSLVSIVISQQLGIVVADTIFMRVKGACGKNLTPQTILSTSEKVFRSAGLSGAKIKTLREIATAIKNKSIDLLELSRIQEKEATVKLLRIWGIGPWSAEMFLMNIGREDVFSVGDLGLIRSMENIYDLPKGTSRGKLLAITERWSPYRTFASHLLWATRNAQIKSNLKSV